SDTGIGIPEEERENIFEKFYEAGESLRHSSGTIEFMSGSLGLGLSIVKSIVERHGGRILVESEVGKGSTFTVELPLEGEFCKREVDAALR
ncbi:MAG: ATP-binding protein, partial [Planctomycetota bacterium]